MRIDTTFIHKIHMGSSLPTVRAGRPHKLSGEVVYKVRAR